jgi:predicted O-methyltransferase YrrM
LAAERWAAVDRYLTELLVEPDPVRDAALAAGLPPQEVSPLQGKLLRLLARLVQAERILELGTLGGYSTIWLAQALPGDGELVSLETDPGYASLARANVARAGLEAVVRVVEGPALETLPGLTGPFDLIFVDADKANNAEYLAWSLELSRPGTLIVADNVVRGGEVADAESRDPRVQGIRRFFELVAAEPRLSATAIQTVGAKGWDGFALAVVS